MQLDLNIIILLYFLEVFQLLLTDGDLFKYRIQSIVPVSLHQSQILIGSSLAFQILTP
jgi:hypothetical protein